MEKGHGFPFPVRSPFDFSFARAVRQGTREAAGLHEVIKEGDVLEQKTVGYRCRDGRLMLIFRDLGSQSKVVHESVCVVCMFRVPVHIRCLYVHVCACISKWVCVCLCKCPACVCSDPWSPGPLLLSLVFLLGYYLLSTYLPVYHLFLLTSHTVLKTCHGGHPVKCICVTIL